MHQPYDPAARVPSHPRERRDAGPVVSLDGPLWRDDPGAPLRPPPRRADARPRRRRRSRPLRRLVLLLLAAVLATPFGTYAWAETRLNRDVDLGTYGHRPPPGKGTTYLIVGSDSRAGLTAAEQKDLHTGAVSGRRTDSMILLHTGASGTTMVSLPRDSWVTVPSYLRTSTGKRTEPAKTKLNATFARGGPELLARTVEFNTGVRIDHYAEIGFAGFVKIVDAVGGVRMCLPRAIRDEKSGADLRKGCQSLDGGESLAFVRQRHQEADGDLGRTLNQQKFLSALAHRAATADTVLDPTVLYPALGAGLDTLVVDEDMDLPRLASMVRAVQGVTDGRGHRVNVPVAAVGIPTPQGSAIRWDEKAARDLFDRLREDRPVREPGRGGR
ncbi:LCP family protein [Streptomyces boluensis]|uniref:LytR family transcriptional regulator n=1 Tax=Streptomyces boluensis TaxID=1775135 RepID=A0A964UPC2_9ACTN|nr:LCP family protein [Streptomyces boluensis]NBE52949.1 LytR family transcriptional regulator [Streptomyces boluensis]